MHGVSRRWLALVLLGALGAWSAFVLLTEVPDAVETRRDPSGASVEGDAGRDATSDDADDASKPTAAEPAPPAVEPARAEAPLAVDAPSAPDDAAPAPALRLRVLRWPDDAPVSGARVHVQPWGEAPAHALLASRAGRVAWTPPAEQSGWDVHASAPDVGAATLSLARADLEREHALHLRATDGWIGRVEDVLGTPQAAEIVAWQWWPPRPALLDDGHADGPRLLSHQRRRRLDTLRAGPDGRFRVPALPADDLSELVLAVRGTRRATPPLHVPLPPPGGELPPLVLRAQDELLVQLRDLRGESVAGIELEVDDGPGRRGEPQHRALSDAGGVLRLPRHAGSLDLRLVDPGLALLAARADGAPLQPDDADWLHVPAGTARVLLELARPRRVHGRLRDERDDRVVRGAEVTLELLEDDGGWAPVASGASDPGGGFALVAPLEADDRLLRVRAEAEGYEPWLRELHAGTSDAMGTLWLRPRFAGGVLRGRVTGGDDEPVTGATVALWSAPPEERGAVLPHEPLPPLYAPLGELRSGPDGRFATRLDAASGHQLAVVAEHTDERGLLVRSVVGPLLRDAWLDVGEVVLRLQRAPPALLPLTVEGWPAGRAGVLEVSHWYRLDGTTLTLRDDFAGPEREGEPLRFELPLPRGAESLVELRVDRWPVPAPLVRGEEWIDVPRHGELSPRVLRVPPRVQVSGVVRGLSDAQRERAAVALLGAPVAEWRAEWLGESDRCRRPDAQGRFRFDDVPAGAVALVLYLPGDTEGVEILAQQPLELASDVSGVELVPESTGAAPLEGRPLR